MGAIRRHTDLDVYRDAFDASMRIYELTKSFPVEERYSLTDQIRRSSRAVCANFAEAWRKRRYPASFVSKLNDSEAEAAETQTWLQHAVKCSYVEPQAGRQLFTEYEVILRRIVHMIRHPGPWTHLDSD